MLRIEIDIFSGRPNPTWVVDEKNAKNILDKISKSPDSVADNDVGKQDLGYRGVILEPLTEELMYEYSVPSVFKLASSGSKDLATGISLATEIIKKMPLEKKLEDADATPLEANLQKIVLDELNTFSKRVASLSGEDVPEKVQAPADVCCKYERTAFNPGFWNNAAIISKNNCYNYATNRRTDTFAQPGRATGCYPYSMACDAVTKAALCDGAHKRYNCFPDTQASRNLIAMVVWPGSDYHWYRLHSDGFWGHKMGPTAAKNIDNCNKVIYNPETCCRGPYTLFCGYFYTCKSMNVK
jgi:hypothetical protein